MKRVLLLLTVSMLLFGVVPYLTAFIVVAHPFSLHYSRQNPSAYSLPYQDVTFPANADKLTLSGWFIPATPTKGTIILCHGVFADRTDLSDFAPPLVKAGYSVLAFDFRQRGKSGRSKNTIGKDEVNDLLGAVEYVKQRKDVSGKPIGVMGVSMGASIAIMTAARCKDLRAVVADSGYARMDHAIDQHLWIFFGPLKPLLTRLTFWHGRRMLGFDPKTVSPASQIAQISPRPILLIHSKRDFMIRSSESQALYQAAKEPKELWITPRGRHTKSRFVYPQEYRKKVVGFFAKALSSRGDYPGETRRP
ncbi:MAG: alpha/beta fold hydrolase [Armatimonadetes bacterium]|nr:alpha/beta fold hydrolase [Armatimonadota bacterium]